jgi:membrane protein implicated in regulation of membrane protease activity
VSKHRRRGRTGEAVDLGPPEPVDPAGPLAEVALYGLLGALVAAVVMLASGMPWWQAALVPALAVVAAGVLMLVWSGSRPSNARRATPAAGSTAEPGKGRRRRR